MSAKPRRIIAPAAPKRASVTVVGQNLIRGQHKADAEEEGENGEDREKRSDRHDDASLGLSPKAKCRQPCQFSTAMGRCDNLWSSLPIIGRVEYGRGTLSQLQLVIQTKKPRHRRGF